MYFKSLFRHLVKHKLHFIFKIAGLCIALFCLLIIITYLSFQFSFDKFHEDYQNVYRVNSIRYENNVAERYATVPTAVGPLLKESFGNVKSFARISLGGTYDVKFNEKQYQINAVVEADSSIFNVLTFEFIRGDRRSLWRPGSIVLTESIAKEFFGNLDPMSRVITFPEHANAAYEVTGIIADVAENSHLYVNAIGNFHSLGERPKPEPNKIEVSWDASVFLYVRLAANQNVSDFGLKVSEVMRHHINDSEKGDHNKFEVFFQPIADVYLGPSMQMQFFMKFGNPFYVKLFFIFGIFLILISAINYTILSIADFESRMKEISMRKIMGADKRQIGLSAIAETGLTSLFALTIAFLLFYITSPTISEVIDMSITWRMIFQPLNIILIAVVVVFLVIISSAYPAYKLSTQRPLADLVSNELLSRTGKVLLIVQFSISVFCITATMVVGRQLSLFKDADIGYDRSNLVQLNIPHTQIIERAIVLKNEIEKISGVSSSTISHYPAVSVYFKDSYDLEIDGQVTTMLVNEMFVDYDYFKTLNIEILAGRNFSVNSPSDSITGYIVNETAAKQFGWKDPIGKKIKYHANLKEGTVIGLVKDFNTKSLHDPIEPLVVRLPYDNWSGQFLIVKVTGDIQQVIPVILSKYQDIITGSVPQYSIVDDVYNNSYRRESKAFDAMEISVVVIGLISIVGIFAISVYVSGRRMKEFGIRKILGASPYGIAGLQTMYFLRIAFVSVIMGLTLSYWTMRDWLNGFAYRTSLDGMLFVQAAFVLFALVVVVSAYSAWRSAVIDPLKVIRND
ncbi:MAG TPA: FtsX-like permease family protein [Chryseolinea sp.]|nr:FtsX-like permease family protein [Chryseolinea sp.]